MSHIDKVPSLLYLAYVKKGLGVREGAEWVRKKIERSWNKLCPEAQDIIKDKYDSAMKLLM